MILLHSNIRVTWNFFVKLQDIKVQTHDFNGSPPATRMDFAFVKKKKN